MSTRLSPEEIDDFLLTSLRVILGIARPDGAPVLLPMWFTWVEGKLLMDTMAASRKVARLRARPEVTCLAESGRHYYTLKAVRLRGTCRIVDDPARVAGFHDLLVSTKPIYKGLLPERWPPALARRRAQPRVVLEVTPTDIVSWDNRKLRR